MYIKIQDKDIEIIYSQPLGVQSQRRFTLPIKYFKTLDFQGDNKLIMYLTTQGDIIIKKQKI